MPRAWGQLAEVSDPWCDRQGNCRATENVVLVEGPRGGGGLARGCDSLTAGHRHAIRLSDVDRKLPRRMTKVADLRDICH